MTVLEIPELSLVVLVGPSGSGKSTFAAKHFGPSQVLSADAFRAMVSDDDNDQSASKDAFEALHYLAGVRLRRGRLTVIDATNVQPQARRELIKIARDHDVLPVAIVLDLPERDCLANNAKRVDRQVGDYVIRRHKDQLRRSLKSLAKEGFRAVHVLSSVEEIDSATLQLHRLRSDRRDEAGPFDVIGDVHGCLTELESLLDELGYQLVRDDLGRAIDAIPPTGRKAIFLGDLVDRGPDSPGVLRLVMGMVEAAHALCVPGNHEHKLVRALSGRAVRVSHGLAETLAQLDSAAQPNSAAEDFKAKVRDFCDGLVAHLVLDEGRLVVAHAGLKEAYHGRTSGRVRAFALYGDTTGETDEFGLPVRYPWATDYRGQAMVLYGHTPSPEAEWVNNTMCLDTGCVFGGKLSALRYPEKELVQVPAEQVYYEPARPLAPPERDPDILELTDVLGRRSIETRYAGRIAIGEDNAAGALEVMSRFAIDPARLSYLPPTMSPPATSRRADLLEHPDEAFDYFREQGVARVICEEKHMGSRAVLLIRRDGTGELHTRTGRPFFDAELTAELVGQAAKAAEQAGLFAELSAEWLLWDCELLPWSAKGDELIREQFASVGAAARTHLAAASSVLCQAIARGVPVEDLAQATEGKATQAEAFAAVYRRYRWPVEGLAGLKLAPFQLLASSAATYETSDHLWHLGLADRMRAIMPELFAETRRRVVELDQPASLAEAVTWWEELTAGGGEGMVVKPLANLTRGKRGLVQPGIKVRGREYLRIIYGLDYTDPDNLARLRDRKLGHKRSLALREYALGLEGLARFVDGDPLWRVHECVFAVLALESEPVDPRL